MIPDDNEVKHWFFAVGGLQTSQPRIDVNRAIRLQRLMSYPSAATLSRRLRNLATAGCMAEHAGQAVGHELVFDAAFFDDHDAVVHTARLALAALRIRTGAAVFCPAVCERSWADLDGEGHAPLLAFRVEQVARSHAAPVCQVSPEDLDWVARSLAPIYKLQGDQRFETAIEALCLHLQAGSLRMMAAQLWAGVEAIFDIQHELSYRVAALTARLLEERGPACHKLFKQVRKLYDERSKVVHGAKVDEKVLRPHVEQVRALLARLLTAILKRGGIPTREEFEEMMFTK